MIPVATNDDDALPPSLRPAPAPPLPPTIEAAAGGEAGEAGDLATATSSVSPSPHPSGELMRPAWARHNARRQSRPHLVWAGSGGVFLVALFVALVLHHTAPPSPNRPTTAGSVPGDPDGLSLFTKPAPAAGGAGGLTTGAAAAGAPAANDPAAAAFALGLERLQHHQQRAAIAAFHEAVQQNPRLTAAHINLAILYLQTGQASRAIESLQTARKLEPANPAIPMQLGQAYAALRRPSDALVALRQAVHLQPANPQVRGMLVQLLLAMKRPAEALAQSVEIARLRPGDARAAFATAELAAEQANNLPEAEKWARRAVALDAASKKPDPQPALLLSKVLMARHRPEAAEQAIARAVHLFPGALEPAEALFQLRLARHDARGADAALRRALEHSPATGAASVARGQGYVMLARLEMQTRQPAAAVRDFQQANLSLPHQAPLHAELAGALAAAGKPAGAVDEVRQVIKLDPHNLAARHMLAQMLASAGQLEAAQTQYSLYLKARPRDASALAEAAELYEKRHQTEQAAAAWRQLSLLMPGNPLPALHRAHLLQDEHHDAAALQVYREVLQSHADQPDALLAAAQLEDKSGQTARAATHLRALIAARPKFALPYFMLMQVAAKDHQVPAAVNFLVQRAAHDPDLPYLYDAILEGYRSIGQNSQGLLIVERLVREHPGAAAPHQALSNYMRRHPITLKSRAVPNYVATPAPSASESPAPLPRP